MGVVWAIIFATARRGRAESASEAPTTPVGALARLLVIEEQQKRGRVGGISASAARVSRLRDLLGRENIAHRDPG
jgi:hypothetical protein